MTLISKAHHSKGIFLLILTTAVWGTSFPLLKDVLNELSPPAILAVRFAIAAIAFLPHLRNLNPGLVRDGALLGLLYFTECLLALKGLETISANRSAFLISLNVILVPLLGVILGRYLPRRILIAAGIAIVGIGILSWEGGGFGLGDLLAFGCAVGVAVYILALERITPRHPTLPLVAVQLTTMAFLGMSWALPQLSERLPAISHHWQTLLYLGLIVTATPIWTQAQAQRWVSASEAALLYTLEPVFASAFSFVWLGEALGIRGLMGAGLILIATIMSQFSWSRLQAFFEKL
jgi:drug/metabolite transporter (DMT)-like permease